jgi:hypothetical protein
MSLMSLLIVVICAIAAYRLDGELAWLAGIMAVVSILSIRQMRIIQRREQLVMMRRIDVMMNRFLPLLFFLIFIGGIGLLIYSFFRSARPSGGKMMDQLMSPEGLVLIVVVAVLALLFRPRIVAYLSNEVPNSIYDPNSRRYSPEARAAAGYFPRAHQRMERAMQERSGSSFWPVKRKEMSAS